MTTDFAIDSSVVELAPFSQVWQKPVVATDHNGAPIYSAFSEVVMQFEAASVTGAREWIQAADGTAKTIDMLGEDVSLGFKTYSDVYVTVETWPDIQSIVAGPFTIRILKVR